MPISTERSFDAVIAGASFAGLAVAREIEGDVVVLDRKPPGRFQTSACGTFLRTMMDFGCEGAILQTFESAVFHAPRPVRIKLIDPLVTIDYERFCRTMLDGVDGFRLAEVRGLDGATVKTSADDFRSDCLVDCTGWRAALASHLMPELVCEAGLAFGIEVEAEHRDDDIHFIFDRQIVRDGYGWVFPAGGTSRIGVGTFSGRSRLRGEFSRLLSRLGVDRGRAHGGFIPFAPRPATVGDIFVVGDSAGHAIPFTLEGIRRSLYLGRACGRIVNDIIRGRSSLRDGLAKYRRVAERSRLAYRFLSAQQSQYARDGGSSLRLLLKLFATRGLGSLLQRAYFTV